MNDTNNRPERLNSQAVRERVVSAGPAGISERDLLSWARATFLAEDISRSRLAFFLDAGVDADWCVEYGAGMIRDGHPVDTQTYVAAEHARPSAAEILYVVRQAGVIGQRRQDLWEWLQTRYPGNQLTRLGQLDSWLGELTGDRKIIPHDREGMTYFIAAEYDKVDQPQELGRLRLPVQISEYSRWLNALDQIHADRREGARRGISEATTSYVRVEEIDKAQFAVFYDRPVT